MILHRDSGLLAVVCDDMSVRLIDIETHKVVRELTGFHGRILDIVRCRLRSLVYLLTHTNTPHCRHLIDVLP